MFVVGDRFSEEATFSTTRVGNLITQGQMKKNCLICERIAQIKNNSNPYFVTELCSGYVVLADYQFYKGYTLFLSKKHTQELHGLRENRTTYLKEMAIVAEAVFKVFKPSKLNYELLGNTDSHLHWHIVPRYENDPDPGSSIWIIDKKIRYSDKVRPTEDDLIDYKKALIKTINRLI